MYVNPYTAQFTGTLPLLHGEPPVQSWLRNFHGDLQLGKVGAVYSELAASWLPVLFLGGLVLWIGKRRARRCDLFVPGSTRPGRGRMMSWHGSTGIWLTVALVFISLTGLTWSTYARQRFETVLSALDARSHLVENPADAHRQTAQRIETGLQRQRQPERPSTTTARARFVNPPPMTAPAYFQGRERETALVADYLRTPGLRVTTVVDRAGPGRGGQDRAGVPAAQGD